MKSYNKIIIASLFVISEMASAQVGIGTLTPDDSAILELSSTSKGFLLPRLSSVKRDEMNNPPVGLMIYNTTTGRIETNKGSQLGALWISMSGVSDTNPIDFPTLNQNTTGTSANVTGIVLPANGGTGIANNTASTLSLSGNFPIAITTTSATNIEFPTEGKLFGTKLGSITSSEVSNAVNDENGTGTLVFSTSPSLSGIPLAPTAAISTNTTQIATTAFVLANSAVKYEAINSTVAITTNSHSDIVVPGLTFSPQAGTYFTQFNAQYKITPIDVTVQGVLDLQTAYNQLMSIPNTATHGLTFGTGEVLYPGVYTIAGAGSIAGVLTLNGNGDSNSVFIFKITGAFNTGASSSVVLTNGASACNVFWISDGAVGLGASTSLKGTVLSYGSAVAVGANCLVEGKMLTTSGAIAFGPGIAITPVSCSLINFGILTSFSMFTSSGGIGNTGTSTINGDIGTNLGAITGFETSTINGTIFLPGMQNAKATFSVYQNGVVIPSSIRTRANIVNTVDISLQTIATVGAGEAIDIRWNVDSGSLKLENRNFTILNVR
jgi:hypothetical protein